MKRIISILTLGFLTSFMLLPKADKIIIWSENKLTWTDFEGKMHKSETYDAVTSSGIRNEFSGEDFKLKFVISANFYPKKSKKKKDKQTAGLLNHEQRHFDITEYFARKLKQSIQETSFKKLDKISTKVNKLYTKNNSLWQKMQAQYDKETNHSKNIGAQASWDLKIDSLLNTMNDYKTTHFEIDVSHLK